METDFTAIKRCVAHLIKEFDYQKKELKGAPLKELVAIVKSNGTVIPAFMDTLFGHFRRDDCDVRLAALSIANHFFQRSHNFRTELTNSIQDFLIYTLETDPLHYPLPKPPEAANLLKKESLAVLRCWIEKFGPGYGKLEKLQNFLKSSKSIDWENARVELSIDRERESREQFQREIQARKVTETIAKLFAESRSEIERLLVESQNVIEMIFPKFCPLNDQKFAIASSQNSKEQLHGFGLSTALTISINPTGSNIEHNCDNEALFNQLCDTTAQLEIWWTKLGKWLKKLASFGDFSAGMLQRIISVRQSLGDDLQKCRELGKERKAAGGEELSASEDDDDSDLVDVEEKEGYEPIFSVGNEYNNKSDKGQNRTIVLGERPGPSGFKARKEPTKEKDGERNELRREGSCNEEKRRGVPKLAMGLDLKYWGEEHIQPAERIRNQADHQFWGPSNDNADNVPTEHIEAYHSRQITFVGQMVPAKKRCRAPLPSGKLCPRMEHERCALHGPIIDRDEMGFPQKEQKDEDEHLFKESSSMGKAVEQQQEEDEAEFLRDVEEATGAKLTVKNDKIRKKCTKRGKKTTKKRKGKKKKKTARERPKSKSVKSRERLVAKLFDKRTLKRVTKTLEQMQKARAHRKFSSQFNYALERQ